MSFLLDLYRRVFFDLPLLAFLLHSAIFIVSTERGTQPLCFSQRFSLLSFNKYGCTTWETKN